MAFQAKLRSVLDSNLAELSTTRKSTPQRPSEDADPEEIVSEVISLKKLRLRVRDDWQLACEEYTASHEGNQLDEDLIVGYAEGAVREYILDVAYEEPSAEASSEARSAFYTKMFDSLDIGLLLFEVAFEQYQTTASLDAGASLSVILEELGDVLSNQSWSVIFGWVERRAESITSGMQPSKGKSLTLLKLFNHLLQQTSHVMIDFGSNTDTLLLRARIHLFITEWFRLNDMSGVNLRGEYSEMRSRWPGMDGEEDEDELEQDAVVEEDEGPVDSKAEEVEGITVETEEVENAPADSAKAQNGDAAKSEGTELDAQATEEAETGKVDESPAPSQQKIDGAVDGMEVDEPEAPKKAEDKPEEPKTEDLYAAMYHLQVVFANPPSLVGSRPVAGTSSSTSSEETPLEGFKRRTAIVLKAMSDKRGETIEMAKSMREAAFAGVDDADLRTNEYPAFLVSRQTIEADLANPVYCKRIYTQFIILLHQLTQLTEKERPKHPKTTQFPPAFSVAISDAEWAGETATQVKSELMKLPDGRDLEARIRKMIEMDRHYAFWKQLSCPPLEQKPADDSTIDQAEANRRRIIAPLRPYRWSAGTKSLSRLGTDPLTDIEQLKGFKVAETVESLKAKYDREVEEEEDEKAMGRDDPTKLGPFVENKASLSWKALRLASRTDLNAFPKARNGDLSDLVAAIEARRAEQAGTGPAALDNEESNNMESIDAAGDTPVPEENPSSADVLLEDAGVETTDVVKDEAESDSMLIERENDKAETDAVAENAAKDDGTANPASAGPAAMEVETKTAEEQGEEPQPGARESAAE